MGSPRQKEDSLESEPRARPVCAFKRNYRQDSVRRRKQQPDSFSMVRKHGPNPAYQARVILSASVQVRQDVLDGFYTGRNTDQILTNTHPLANLVAPHFDATR